ncbi:hypothetical protein PMEL1_01385 [Prevotella melaninogenica]|uniref:Uncharacterized protein n=1 Tax=Prevotella melaninogenica TaxID=28132 RepID=A0A250KI80_9BACT|nr:hypothetical protein PMEL1_01385 [Prevotella melaninogenica]
MITFIRLALNKQLVNSLTRLHVNPLTHLLVDFPTSQATCKLVYLSTRQLFYSSIFV